MSRAVDSIETVKILDPVTRIEAKRTYGVLLGGQRVQEKVEQTQDYSNSQFGFTINPPSRKTIVDRNIRVSVPVTIDFTGTSAAGARLLNTDLDAFRANPLASITETLAASINGQTVSAQIGDIKDPLLRYNNGLDQRQLDYSTSPAMQDHYQRYDQHVGTSKNPLAGFGNGFEVPRGAFQYEVFTNTSTTAQIQATLVEPLFLSPFVFGHENRSGFTNVYQMSFTWNLSGNLGRIWSHATTSPVTSTIATITVTIGRPSLLVKYITPRMSQSIPKSISYPLYNVVHHPTMSSFSVAPNASDSITSQSIQLNTVPRRMYLCVRKRKQDRTFLDADAYCGIDSINVEYNNQAGLLSTATRQDLYRMSVRNGYNGSYQEWSGDVTYDASGDADPVGVGLSGSVACIEFGTDIALGVDSAPGMLEKNQLQVTVDFHNVNQVETFVPELSLIIVYEGVFTISDTMTVSQIGILNKMDVIKAGEKTNEVDYFMIRDAYGGNFFSGLKEVGRKFISGAKQVAKHGKVIAENLPAILEKSMPIAEKIAKHAPALLSLLGAGLSDEMLERAFEEHMASKGGVLLGAGRKKKGGRGISKAELKKRLGL